MKIVACHNYYQIRGGEDQSFEDEVALLRSRGDEVVCYTKHNDEVEGRNRLAVAAQTLWSRRTAREFANVVQEEKPDVVHFTNTFPLISPSAYRVARRFNVPVVQALRNYRWLCANGYFMRDERVCEDCLGRTFAWPAVKHGCYRGSGAGSLVVAGLQQVNRVLGQWTQHVDAFYTLTDFAKEKLVAGGFRRESILVKPNSVAPDPRVGFRRGRVCGICRQTIPEKGIRTLFDAWRRLPDKMPLKIIGEGPLESEAIEFARERQEASFLGRLDLPDVLNVVGDATVLVMPSVWYETFGRTIVEAYAKGTPVIASRLGAMAELVKENETGFLFNPGDAVDLSSQVVRLWHMSAERQAALRSNARAEYERHYTPERNYDYLQDIYRRARETHALRRRDRNRHNRKEAAQSDSDMNECRQVDLHECCSNAKKRMTEQVVTSKLHSQ